MVVVTQLSGFVDLTVIGRPVEGVNVVTFVLAVPVEVSTTLVARPRMSYVVVGPVSHCVTVVPETLVAVSTRATLPSVGWAYPVLPGAAEVEAS